MSESQTTEGYQPLAEWLPDNVQRAEGERLLRGRIMETYRADMLARGYADLEAGDTRNEVCAWLAAEGFEVRRGARGWFVQDAALRPGPVGLRYRAYGGGEEEDKPAADRPAARVMPAEAWVRMHMRRVDDAAVTTQQVWNAYVRWCGREDWAAEVSVARVRRALGRFFVMDGDTARDAELPA